jgi:hypothetical protein
VSSAEPVASADPAATIAALEANLARVVHAPAEVLRLVVLCLVAEGHLIVEDFPGVGKTTLAKARARARSTPRSRASSSRTVVAFTARRAVAVRPARARTDARRPHGMPGRRGSAATRRRGRAARRHGLAGARLGRGVVRRRRLAAVRPDAGTCADRLRLQRLGERVRSGSGPASAARERCGEPVRAEARPRACTGRRRRRCSPGPAVYERTDLSLPRARRPRRGARPPQGCAAARSLPVRQPTRRRARMPARAGRSSARPGRACPHLGQRRGTSARSSALQPASTRAPSSARSTAPASVAARSPARPRGYLSLRSLGLSG